MKFLFHKPFSRARQGLESLLRDERFNDYLPGENYLRPTISRFTGGHNLDKGGLLVSNR
jgi:hypothetical protein